MNVPKVVDHAARRAEIADALWRVIRRDGIGAASVRTVAAESGWSTGALRHYFSTQSELLAFATAMLIERTTSRIRGMAQRLETLDDLIRLLEEVVPLDANRLADSEVWLAMVAASRTDPSLRPLTEEAHRGLRKLSADVVMLIDEMPGTPSLDRTLEADRLHALLDGLALHGTLYPKQLPRTRIRQALRSHVERLASSG